MVCLIQSISMKSVNVFPQILLHLTIFMYAVGLLVFVGAKIFIELSNRLNSLCIGTIPQNIVPNIKPNKD